MPQTIQIKRRNSGSAGAPATMAAGEMAWNAVDQVMYFGSGDNGSGVATSIVKLAGTGAFILATLIGAASGVAPLDSSGKVPIANIPSSVIGALNYQGTWNASTNSPSLTSGTGTKGFYYKISTAGSTSLDGISQWNVGDIVAFNGATWDKIDGIPSEVVSVAGRSGAVVLSSTDITDASTVGKGLLTALTLAAQRAALKIDSRTTVSDANYTAQATDYNIQYTAITAARTVTLAAASSFIAGTRIRIGDSSGSASSSLTITIARSGSDTINGGTGAAIAAAYGQIELMSDGSGAFTLLNQTAATPTNVDGGTY